jgi:hypothetical protein
VLLPDQLKGLLILVLIRAVDRNARNTLERFREVGVWELADTR